MSILITKCYQASNGTGDLSQRMVTDQIKSLQAPIQRARDRYLDDTLSVKDYNEVKKEGEKEIISLKKNNPSCTGKQYGVRHADCLDIEDETTETMNLY